ncbi:MAG: hypothetical protein K9L73_02380 [Spirochaetia bacterium]|nr:hypothetical protein [Spirochaetia bacterium]
MRRITTYLVIDTVIKEYNLVQMLSTWIGKGCALVLDLAVARSSLKITQGCTTLTSHTAASKMRIFSDSSVSRLLGSLTKDQSVGFLNDWDTHRDHRQRICISYDSMGKNCPGRRQCQHIGLCFSVFVQL